MNSLFKQIREVAWRVYDRWILNTHDVIVIWLAEAVHRWSDANTVARAFEVPASGAQRAFRAIETSIEQWGRRSRVLRLISKPVDCWERQTAGYRFLFAVSAIVAVGVIGMWWRGEPLKLSLHGVFAAMCSGLMLIYFALLLLNLLGGAALVTLILLSLPLHLWRAAEVITAFAARILPFSVRFRYRSWRLRRIGQRLFRGTYTACGDQPKRDRDRWVQPIKTAIAAIAALALTSFLATNYNSRSQNYPADAVVPRSHEIRRAIPVELEIRRAIPIDPEIRKAIPVQTVRNAATRRMPGMSQGDFYSPSVASPLYDHLRHETHSRE